MPAEFGPIDDDKSRTLPERVAAFPYGWAAKGHERLLSLIQSGDYHVPDGETLKRSDQTE